MSFANVLKSSFDIFVSHPLFIVPKLIVAIFYSVLILVSADITEKALLTPSIDVLFVAIALLVLSVAVALADIFVSSMYPVMVRQVKSKKNLSLRRAFDDALSNIGVVFPPVIAVELGFLFVILILSLPISFLIASETTYVLVFSFFYIAVVLVAVFLFYLLFPVLVYERKSFMDSFERSVSLSLRNKSVVGKATVVSFLFSLFSFIIAFAIEFLPQSEGTILFWIAFLILRFFTAYIYSYLFVLNPVLYREVVE